jgi:hypothetical protein
VEVLWEKVFSTVVRAEGFIRRTLAARILSWKAAVIQTGFEPGSRGIAVKSRYQETSSDE